MLVGSTTTAATTTSTAAAATTAATTTCLLGDVDRNGKITAVDASFILDEYATLMIGGSTPKTYWGDVDRDGKITAVDASFILAYYAEGATGSSPAWPVPKLSLEGSYMFASPKEVTMGENPFTLGPGEHFGVEGMTEEVMYIRVPKAPEIVILPYTTEELQNELIRVS